MAAASPYRLRIEGMDCASCALKIETAMQRLPGVSDINVSYANETLALQLDEDRAALGTIEQKIRALGYTPVIEQAETKGGPPRKRITEAWWKGSKGRLVLLTGALFMLAFAIARILPDWEQWLYSGAALISVIPFARRAGAGAMYCVQHGDGLGPRQASSKSDPRGVVGPVGDPC